MGRTRGREGRRGEGELDLLDKLADVMLGPGQVGEVETGEGRPQPLLKVHGFSLQWSSGETQDNSVSVSRPTQHKRRCSLSQERTVFVALTRPTVFCSTSFSSLFVLLSGLFSAWTRENAWKDPVFALDSERSLWEGRREEEKGKDKRGRSLENDQESEGKEKKGCVLGAFLREKRKSEEHVCVLGSVCLGAFCLWRRKQETTRDLLHQPLHQLLSGPKSPFFERTSFIPPRQRAFFFFFL